MNDPSDRIIVALDFSEEGTALEWVDRLRGRVGVFKIGLQLFVSRGPEMVRRVRSRGVEIFLDLKLHDIPNTVAHAAVEAGRLGIRMLTLHTLGGAEMLRRTRELVDETADKEGWEPPLLLGITILTSLDRPALERLGLGSSVEDSVVRLSFVARRCGLDGIVASARELSALREAGLNDLTWVTPGIRPAGTDSADQRRTRTPAQAIRGGADYLVIGRPITSAADPLAAIASVSKEIENV